MMTTKATATENRFAAIKGSMEKAEKGLNVFFDKRFQGHSPKEAEFVQMLKSLYNDTENYEKKYATVPWTKLMSELIDFDYLQDAISEEIGSHKVYFIKNFQLGNSTFKAGKPLDKKYTDALILELNHMILTTGNMNSNTFMTELPVRNSHDKTMQKYEEIQKNGKEVKDIVEDFVTGYIGWSNKSKSESASYQLAVQNIVRMVKQAYNLTKQSNMIERPEDFRVFSQLYVMPGAQGAGKTTFLTDLFFGNISASDGFTRDSQYTQKRSMNPVYFFDEMSSINTRQGVGEMKAEVSSPMGLVNVKYDKFPVPFLKRSVIVGATNEHQLLTDTTSGGENRRYLFIPFTNRTNAELNTERIIDFWEKQGCGLRLDGENYDTTDYFTNFQYSILFGTQYADVPIEIRNDKETLKLNTMFGSQMKHTTSVQQLVEEFLSSHLAIVCNYNKMSTGSHRAAIMKMDEATELFEQGLDEDDILSKVNGSFGGDYEYSRPDDFDKIISISKIKQIRKNDVLDYLKQHDARLKNSQELSDAFEMMGYQEGTYRSRACFIKNSK